MVTGESHMKIVVAPQSFKGSLSARGVAEAMAVGIARVHPDADVVLLPMADGGEGTVDALVFATGGTTVTTDVTGPLGDRVAATWGVLGDERTAVIEMAAASGLVLVSSDRLDPFTATTYGTGELIRAALDAGYRRLIIGIGGSATNDGGAGMAQSLGAKFTDAAGDELPQGGAALADLRHIDIRQLDRRLKECRITVASDVINPLCGPDGASWVYGPQKGATDDMCRRLDEALANYAAVVERDLGISIRDRPGAGAAGGLGAGLVVFLGAMIVPGIDIISDAVGLVEHLTGAALAFTGEGRLDAQTLFGKTVAGVAKRAQASHVPLIVIAGELHGDLSDLYRHGIDAALSTAPGPITLEESQASTPRLIADATERALRLVMIDAKSDPTRRD